MAEYEHSLVVQASPDAVFDFISDVGNMPRYLPTTHHAEPQGTDRVRVQGEADGHPYDADGWLRVDRTEFRMEWGSDGERQYRGWMEIDGNGDESEVTIHLTFGARPNEQDIPDTAINQGLQAALASIKNIVEGKGSKVEPVAAH